MKGNQFKKLTTTECHFCDYTYKCRKGHKCNYYKMKVKKYKRSQVATLLYKEEKDNGN